MIPKIDQIVEVKVRVKVDGINKNSQGDIRFSGDVVDENGEKPKRNAAWISGLSESMIVSEVK